MKQILKKCQKTLKQFRKNIEKCIGKLRESNFEEILKYSQIWTILKTFGNNGHSRPVATLQTCNLCTVFVYVLVVLQ